MIGRPARGGDARRRAQAIDDRRALAYGLAGGALAVGFTGALLYWFDRDEPRGLPALAPTVSGDGAGVVLGGAF